MITKIEENEGVMTVYLEGRILLNAQGVRGTLCIQASGNYPD
jgi:hypothetical protein